MIPYGKHYLDDDDIDAVVDVLKNGALTQGPKIAEFEKKVADYVGVKYAVAVSSGTAALHLAYISLGLSEGDLVAMPSNTFAATANAARYVGAEPLFIDISEKDLNIDVDMLEQSLANEEGVKVVSAVHFSGLPAPMERIRLSADEHNVRILEDAAHAMGACYEDGSRVGSCPDLVEESGVGQEPAEPGQRAQMSPIIGRADEKKNIGQRTAPAGKGYPLTGASQCQEGLAENRGHWPARVQQGHARVQCRGK